MRRGPGWIREHRYLLLSLAVAVLTGAYAYTYLAELDQRIEVVLLGSDVPEYTRLDASMLRSARLPVAAVHREALRSENQAVGRYLLRNAVAGEQLLASQLSDDEGRRTLRGRVGRTERAIFIPLSTGRALGGAVKPKDRVDVIFVPNEQKVGLYSAKVLLQNVEVLDVRGERGAALAEGRREADQAFAGVLVAVSPGDAEKIAFCLEHGSLYLALAGFEAAYPQTSGANAQTIFAIPSGLVAPPGAGGK